MDPGPSSARRTTLPLWPTQSLGGIRADVVGQQYLVAGEAAQIGPDTVLRQVCKLRS